MTDHPDASQFDRDDRVRIVLDDGETFEGVVVGTERDPADDYGDGYSRLTLEGDWWAQVRDRVDSEVLHVEQSFARRSGDPQTAVLTGPVWPDGSEGAVDETVLGEVDRIERLG